MYISDTSKKMEPENSRLHREKTESTFRKSVGMVDDAYKQYLILRKAADPVRRNKKQAQDAIKGRSTVLRRFMLTRDGWVYADQLQDNPDRIERLKVIEAMKQTEHLSFRLRRSSSEESWINCRKTAGRNQRNKRLRMQSLL